MIQVSGCCFSRYTSDVNRAIFTPFVRWSSNCGLAQTVDSLWCSVSYLNTRITRRAPKWANTQLIESREISLLLPCSTHQESGPSHRNCLGSRDSWARRRFYSAHCRVSATGKTRATRCRPVMLSKRQARNHFLWQKDHFSPMSGRLQGTITCRVTFLCKVLSTHLNSAVLQRILFLTLKKYC